MSVWTVWQIARDGAPERVGSYPSGADARRVLRASITRGATVDPEGEVDEARGVAPRDVTAIERAAEAWLASATAPTPTVPAPAEVIEIPALVEDDVEPVGVGAATEAPLPVAFEPPVVEPAPRSYAERVEDLRAEIARGRPSADLEHLRVQLADATARAAAEAELSSVTARLDSVHVMLATACDQRDAALATVTLRQSDCDARDLRIATLNEEREGLAAALRERSAQLSTAQARIRAQGEEIAVAATRLARRDRTIAGLRAQLARAAETPVQTIHRRLAEIAEGRR